jgi:hypothetical protein
MKKCTLLSLLLVVSAVFLISTSALGAGGDTFKFSDSYKEKLLNLYGWEDLFYFGKFNINAKIYFDNVDTSQFNSDTCLDVEVGWFSLFTCLGDDPAYQQGKTGTKMVFTGDDYYLGDNIPYLWANLKWNSKKLTIKIKGLTGTPDIGFPIMADDYMYFDPGTYDDSTDATVLLYNDPDAPFIDTSFDMYTTAKVKMKTNRKWDWDLYQVSVKGNGYN